MDSAGLWWLGATLASIVGLSSCSTKDSNGQGVGGSSGGSTGGDASSAAGECGAKLPASLAPLDLLVMLDASTAMSELTGSGRSRWTSVSNGLLSFAKDAASAGIGLGLGHFPAEIDVPDRCSHDDDCGEGAPCLGKICLNVLLELDRMQSCEADVDCEVEDGALLPTCRTIGDCSTDAEAFCFTESAGSCAGGICSASGICSRSVSCEPARFAEPAVAIAEAPGVEAALLDALSVRTPQGETTPIPALSGALEHARSWRETHPDHDLAAVLVTAGAPTECVADGASADEAYEALAEAARDGADDGVRTFVIGISSAAELDAGTKAHLDRVARAGGTEQAFLVDSALNVTNDFWLALNRIRSAARGCELEAPLGDDIDYDEVNLVLSPQPSTTTRIPRVTAERNCDDRQGGWYYEFRRGEGQPHRVVACPASCELLKTAPAGSVEFELGCPSEFLQ